MCNSLVWYSSQGTQVARGSICPCPQAPRLCPEASDALNVGSNCQMVSGPYAYPPEQWQGGHWCPNQFLLIGNCKLHSTFHMKTLFV